MGYSPFVCFLQCYKGMSRNLPPNMEVIVIDDEEAPPSYSISREAQNSTSRKADREIEQSQCASCLRMMPAACLTFRTTPPLCADCQGLCSMCRLGISSEPLRCPRCARAYHENCEGQLYIRQICSMCLGEVQSNVKDTVESRFESQTLYGQRYAVVKLKDLSLLHLVSIPENLVQDMPVSGQPPPSPQFEAVLYWKNVGTLRMGLVTFVNQSESTWEYDFVIKALSSPADSKNTVSPSTNIIVEKAQELILAFGFNPEDSIATVQHA